MKHNEVSGAIIETAIMIHRKLGPGLLESVYRKVLGYELRRRGLHVVEEHPIPVVWENQRIDLGFRADIIVEDMVVVEVKSVETVARVHKKQLLTYLRIMDRRLGLLINFNVELLKDGLSRVVNELQD
jgi:GxxExxY protein